MLISNLKDLRRVIAVLHSGGVIIFPTETLYGLVCDATNPAALLKIFKIKERPLGKSFPILVKDLAMLSDYAAVNPEQKKFIQRAKEPTNFVLKAKHLSPLLMQERTAAFRISKHPGIKKLFSVFDRPLVATSANLSKKLPLADPRKYQEVFGKQANLIDLVVFAGVNRKKNGSKIIDLTEKPYRVLRP